MSIWEYFQGVASLWEQMRQSFFPETVREQACSLANVQPGTIAADIGAGTGFITQHLLELG